MGTKFCQLSLEERELISVMRAEGRSLRAIGKALGRHHSSISRELEKNVPPIHKGYYLAHKAHERSNRRKKAAHQRQRLKNERIRQFVHEKLAIGWSPEQISGRIRLECAGLSIGYEAIYQYIYAEAPELVKCLPRHHRKRQLKGHSRKHSKSHIPERVSIAERPDEVGTRERFGDWEADTAVSRQSNAVLLVICERKSRVVFIDKLAGKTSQNVKERMIERMQSMPTSLRRTITYDNGSENVEHGTINTVLGTKSFFCQPYHSWEKGTVENTIGLVRRFFPKKTNFAKVPLSCIGHVENLLNNRPRKCLNYATPHEILSGAIAGGM